MQEARLYGGTLSRHPPEPNDRTESRWIAKLAALLRYIDDGFSLSKINYENSFGFVVNGM